jgi:hypothetical protein
MTSPGGSGRGVPLEADRIPLGLVPMTPSMIVPWANTPRLLLKSRSMELARHRRESRHADAPHVLSPGFLGVEPELL